RAAPRGRGAAVGVVLAPRGRPQRSPVPAGAPPDRLALLDAARQHDRRRPVVVPAGEGVRVAELGGLIGPQHSGAADGGGERPQRRLEIPGGQSRRQGGIVYGSPPGPVPSPGPRDSRLSGWAHAPAIGARRPAFGRYRANVADGPLPSQEGGRWHIDHIPDGHLSSGAAWLGDRRHAAVRRKSKASSRTDAWRL